MRLYNKIVEYWVNKGILSQWEVVFWDGEFKWQHLFGKHAYVPEMFLTEREEYEPKEK